MFRFNRGRLNQRKNNFNRQKISRGARPEQGEGLEMTVLRVFVQTLFTYYKNIIYIYSALSVTYVTILKIIFRLGFLRI